MSSRHGKKATQPQTWKVSYRKGRMTQRAEPRPQRAELRNTKGISTLRTNYEINGHVGES